MPHISIIIVDYNGEKDTRECLQSLKLIKRETFTCSVIVVDNGSKLQLSIPEDKLPKNTVIVRSDANLGFTSGNNLGIKYAAEHFHPDYLLLLNNDTVVEPSFLEEMLACAEKNERVGAVTSLIYFAAGREYHRESYKKRELGHVFWYAGGSIDWQNLDAFHRGVDEIDRGQFDLLMESDFATGCCILVPWTVLKKTGLLNKKYFLYLEDVELSQRILAQGLRILTCPTAKIWHKNAGSSGGAGSALHQYYQTRNRLHFFFTFGPVRSRLTTLKYAMRLFLRGSMIERRATFDWFTGRMGKQAIL